MISKCLVCSLNQTKRFLVLEGEYWQIDTPVDIRLPGLFFIKTKRHVESLTQLNAGEQNELGKLIKRFAQKSKKIAHAQRVVTLCLGFKDPHVHFWIIPVTKSNKPNFEEISQAVKKLADKYR